MLFNVKVFRGAHPADDNPTPEQGLQFDAPGHDEAKAMARELLEKRIEKDPELMVRSVSFQDDENLVAYITPRPKIEPDPFMIPPGRRD